jgi:hypothetical protein
MSLGFFALFEWTLRQDERLHQPVPAAAKNAARARFYVGQVPYLLAVGVSFISAPIALIITALVAVYYVFERTPGAPKARADATTGTGTGTGSA